MRALPIVLLAVVLLSVGASAGGADASSDSRRDLVEAYRCLVTARLERIHAGDRTTSRDRFLTVSLAARPDAYVQCIFHSGDTRLFCEASSGAYRMRPGEAGPAAPAGDLSRLAALGFATAGTDRNLVREIDLVAQPDLGRAAELILTALHDGYGARSTNRLRLRAPQGGDPRSVPAECVPTG